MIAAKVIFCSVFLLELVTRIYRYWRHGEGIKNSFYTPSPKTLSFRNHPYILYVKKENNDAKSLYPSNSLGYAGKREISKSKSPDTIRILCAGGSAVEGHDMMHGADSSWPAKLQDILQTKFRDAEIECINGGTAGYTTAESLIEFMLRGVDLKPDILLIYHNANDAWQAQMVDGFKPDYSHVRCQKPLKLPWLYLIPQVPYFAAYQTLRRLLLERISKANALIYWISNPPWPLAKQITEEITNTFRRNIIHFVLLARGWGCLPVLIKGEGDRTRKGSFSSPCFMGNQREVAERFEELFAANNKVLNEVALRFDCPYIEAGPFDSRHFSDIMHLNGSGLDEMSRRLAGKVEPLVSSILKARIEGKKYEEGASEGGTCLRIHDQHDEGRIEDVADRNEEDCRRDRAFESGVPHRPARADYSIGLDVAYPGREKIFGAAPLKDRNGTAFHQFNQEFGFWGIPDIKRDVSFEQRREALIRVSHNAEGNRDKPFPKEKMKNTILCIGGSHTWGEGVEQHLRYSSLLKARMKRPVLNLGHLSLGLDQICLFLIKKALSYSPEIVIVEQCPWAIRRVLNSCVNGYVKPRFHLSESGQLLLKKTPNLARFKLFCKIIGSYYCYQKEFREYKAGINLKEGYHPSTDPIFLFWKTHYYDYMYQLVDKLLEVMKDFCRQNGIKLFFALGAVPQQFGPKSPSALIDYELPLRHLIHILEKNKIPYIDMTDSLLAEYSEQEPVIFADGQINEKGHGIFAKVLHNQLERLGWLGA